MNHVSKYVGCCLGALVAFHSTSGIAATDKSAQAVNSYAGISGDFTWPNHSDLGGGGRVTLGGRINPLDMGSFRGELEAGYHTADGETGFGDVRYFNYMANAYYDLASRPSWVMSDSWHMTPYIGAGLGMASIRYGRGDFTSTFHHHTNAFAYQGMAGLAFVAADSPNTEWTVGYRYLGTSRENGAELHANNLELGLKYHF